MIVEITQRTVLHCTPYEKGAVVDVPLPTGRLLISIGKARPFVATLPYETAMVSPPEKRSKR